MGTFYSFIHCVFLERLLHAKHWGEHGGCTGTKPCHSGAQGLPWRQTESESGIIVEPETRCCRHIKWAMKSTALSKWAKLGCAIRNLHLSGLSNKQLSHAYVTCIAQVYRGPTLPKAFSFWEVERDFIIWNTAMAGRRKPKKNVLLKAFTWDFPGSLVIKTPWFHWRGAGLISGKLWSYIHMMWPKIKKKKKKLLPGSAKHYFYSYSIGQAKSWGYLMSRGKKVSSYHGIWGNRTHRLLISTDTVCMPMIGRLQMEGLSWSCSRDVVDKEKKKETYSAIIWR